MKLIHKFKSLNFDKRHNKNICYLILHYTALPSIKASIQHLCEKKNKVSCHYIIGQNGKIYNLIDDKYRAWHAGQSEWLSETNLNHTSIGIELDFSPNHDNNKYSKLLIESLILLIKNLKFKYKIDKKNILGHSDIAPLRKKDPGEKFPWKRLARNGLSIWYDLNEKKLKTFRNQKTKVSEKKKFISNLKKIGYSKNFKNNIFIIKAFQRRFRYSLINGKIDKECYLISKSLLKSL